jgi:hypothetical protein
MILKSEQQEAHMIFTNKQWDEMDDNDIVVYSNYHKYWQNRELKIKNPLFDVYMRCSIQ